jgi:MGT family glycosyltransferase
LPFVTICNALMLNREANVPPPFTPWKYSDSWFGRARNRLGYLISDRFTRPVSSLVNQYRRQWGLKPYSCPDDSFSRLAQISQQPPLFDFPRRELPPQFHYAGPLRGSPQEGLPFPWEKLDGRPMVYASLGTLQNSRFSVFRCFAEACQDLDVQLVITHGGGLNPGEVAALPPTPIVVSYAPQRELLSRAALTLSHAGLNTVLDSLSYGVPIIAVPITYEQPAIAERLRFTGAGESISLAGLDPTRLRRMISRVLTAGSFRMSAKAISQSIAEAGGVGTAADIILALG